MQISDNIQSYQSFSRSSICAKLSLDLNEYFIKNPVATYFVKVAGDNMLPFGVFSGDILIVDRIAKIKNHSIIIATVNDFLQLFKYQYYNSKVLLKSDTETLSVDTNLFLDKYFWGVVTYKIQALH